MAYTINGKVYTEHPLMDEMIHNLNIILNNIEVKNEEMALSYETGETLEASDIYLSIVGGHATYTTFPMTKQMLELYGFDSHTVQKYLADRNTIPKSDREAVMKFCCNYFVENYYEYNNYYRALIGLPWLPEYEPEETYYVYIDETFVKEPTLVKEINFDKPLHEYSDYQIAILQSLGQMDRIWKMYPSKEYKYLRFLGDRRRDLYTVRHAAKWDILYMPAVEQLVSDRWRQLYEVNRVLGLKREYSEAYKLKSTYYEEFMIILLLCQTYTDMIVDIPEWYIRRDIFDLRTCKYFLESHGIEFFKIIPLKFQILLVKNMNKLIRYKSTDKNIFDIINLFTRDEVIVYKHHMFKRRKANLDGSYVTGNPEDEYELKFVRTPIGDTFDNTIKDSSNIFDYDDITYADKYWDGQDYHDVVKGWHMDKDFTIEGTKYYSMDYNVSYGEYSKQIRYFLGIILDSDMDLSEIKVNVSSISSVISFSLTDLFILLYCFTALYDEYNLVIRTPVNHTYMEKPELEIYEDIDGYDPYVEDYGGVIQDIDGHDETTKRRFRRPIEGGYDPEETELTIDSFYDWLRYKYPYLWLDMSNRIYGFNMDADLDLLAKLVGFRHSTYRWAKGYTLEEIGVANFIVTKKISSIDQFVKMYENNIAIHDNLINKILNANTKDEQVVFQFVYDYLFTKNFDYKRYVLPSTGKLANTYDEILKERNYILYKHYNDIRLETDKETRRDLIRQTMNDIVNTLEYYLNFDFINYIFSAFTVSSFDSIIKYIWLNINFFKSYKVYFLDPYVNFRMDNKLDNTVNMIDQITETKIDYSKDDTYNISDAMSIHGELDITDEKEEHPSGAMETLEVYGYYEPDPTLDLECNGGNLREENWKFLDLDGGGVEEHEYTINIDGKHPIRSNYEDHLSFALPYDICGGTPETELKNDPHDSIPIFRDFGLVDGGGVSIISCCPYNPWNGGRAGAGLLMFDLNGSYDYNQKYYLNINGKYPKEDMLEHTPQKSFYEIDGGHPDFNTFYKPAMVVRIVDDQISAEVRLAADYKNKPNEITIRDDGLYVEDKYGTESTFSSMEIELDDMIDRYRVLFNDSLEQIEFSTNKDKLNQFVVGVVVDEIAIYNKQYFEAVKRIEVTKEEINKYTEEQAEYLEELFHDWNTGLALSSANWGEF